MSVSKNKNVIKFPTQKKPGNVNKLKSIAIYIEPPKGGFGDIASNVQMAEKLREVQPDLSVNIILHREAFEIFGKLVPGFKSDLPFQRLDGIDIYLENGGMLPNTDVLMSFASFSRRPHITTNTFLKAVAPVRIAYREFDGGDSSFSPNGIDQTRFYVDCDIIPFKPGYSFQLNTGVRTGGMYISPKKPKIACTKRGLLKSIRQTMDRPSFMKLKKKLHDIKETDKISFVYSKRAASTSIYLQALYKVQKDQGLRGSRTLVFFKNHANLKLPPSCPGIIYAPYDSIGFSTSKALIYHSTLPVMITGDTSLSLALDYERPFLYETNLWKNAVATDLVQTLTKSSQYFATPEKNKLLCKTCLIDALCPSITVQDVTNVLTDQRYQREFEMVIQKLRAHLSLPVTVLRQIELLKEVEMNAIPVKSIKYIIQLATNGEDDIHLATKLKDYVSDSSHPVEKRLDRFFDIFFLKDWKNEENLHYLYGWLDNADILLCTGIKSALIQRLGGGPRIFEFFSLALESGIPEVCKEATRILYSAHSVDTWEDPLANSSDLATQLLNKHYKTIDRYLREIEKQAA